MPTSRSSSTVRAAAAGPSRPLCSFRVSPIWRSMVWSGFSDVMGSWKIMAMRSPRMPWRVWGSAPSNSVPWKRMLPRGWLAAG